MITEENVRHIAHLARLELSAQEVTAYTEQLGSILHYVDQLASVDTSSVEPTAVMVPDHDPLREDRAEESLSAQDALSNAPLARNGFFAVPKVIEQ